MKPSIRRFDRWLRGDEGADPAIAMHGNDGDREIYRMQNAKDSFYMALRTRMSAVNPARTVLIRGSIRPGILVEEAEAPFTQIPADVFVLRWVGAGVEADLPLEMVAADCEISYQTLGTQAFGGLDRGRMLTEMDKELLAIVAPFQSPKCDYSVVPEVAMLTNVFWDEPVFGPVVTQRDQLCRTVRVRVYSYQEEGE